MYPSIWQILIILLILLLLFGHRRIRELGKALGESLRDFKKGLDEESGKPSDQQQATSSVDKNKSKTIDTARQSQEESKDKIQK